MGPKRQLSHALYLTRFDAYTGSHGNCGPYLLVPRSRLQAAGHANAPQLIYELFLSGTCETDTRDSRGGADDDKPCHS